MVKVFIFIAYTSLLIWFVASFSYEKGALDQIAKTTYIETADNYIALNLLRNASTEEAIKFYESILDLNVEVHRVASENKSFLHSLFKIKQLKPNTEYYMRILKYRKKYPSNEIDSNVIDDIKALIKNEDKTF